MTTEDRVDAPPTDVVSSLHSLLLSGPSVEEFLIHLTAVAARVVSPPASCGVTTHYEGRPLTIATSDERAALIDEDQYGAGQGPCLAALRTGQVVEVTDQRTDHRWEAYREKALEKGVRSSLSLPLIVEDTTIGGLNLYVFDRPNAFDDDQRQRATVFAAQASTALALAIRSAQQTELAAQLEQALGSRTVIDQAIGLLMGQQRCDADTAFALLRKHSQNNNRKLRDVAAELITRVSGHPPVSGRTFEPPPGGSLSETADR
jgi:GAF domain-containing protein